MMLWHLLFCSKSHNLQSHTINRAFERSKHSLSHKLSPVVTHATLKMPILLRSTQVTFSLTRKESFWCDVKSETPQSNPCDVKREANPPRGWQSETTKTQLSLQFHAEGNENWSIMNNGNWRCPFPRELENSLISLHRVELSSRGRVWISPKFIDSENIIAYLKGIWQFSNRNKTELNNFWWFLHFLPCYTLLCTAMSSDHQISSAK